MAKKYKKLKEVEILAAVKANIEDGMGLYDTKLSRERERVLNYFNGSLPAPQHGGNSKYVSQDVYDTVESTKASLLETFSSGYDILQFAPDGIEDVLLAKQASAYTSYVVHRQNMGYRIFSDVITDGLLARVGITKTYWCEDIQETTETFEGVPVESMDALISQEDVTLEDYTLDPETQLVSGTIIRSKDNSRVKIEVIPPEEFMINARAKKADKNTFMAHRVRKTASELIEMGISKALVDSLPREDKSMLSTEELARTQDISTDPIFGRVDYQEQVRTILVHECYIPLDIEGRGTTRLYKILYAGHKLLDKPQEVDRHPFQFFNALPMSHSFFGSSFASKVIPTQNSRSVLIRGILDHTVITNNPRTIVVKGSLVNPKEMLENRHGGVVNVTRPDGIFPYPQSSLNPFVFQTIQLLDEDKEDTTGISKLSQGLNKDAVSNQNSEGLVENLVGLSQQRQKIIARNFAYDFLIPLYIEVYQLLIENEKKTQQIDLGGEWVSISPSQWKKRSDVVATLKLGYGEQAKEGAKLLGVHQLLSSDASLAPMYPPTQKYQLLKAALEKDGMKEIAALLVSPDNPAYQEPQPDPKMMAEVEMLKAKVAESQVKIQIMQMETEHKIALAKAEHELDKKQSLIDMMTSQREQERKEFETKNRAAVAERELDIIEQTPPDKVNQSNIISPNS